MPTDDARARLESELAVHRARALEAAGEAREILSDDLEVFVVRKVKELFVADEAVASAMSDDQLARLKRRAAEVARRQRDAILTILADDDLWLNPGDVPADPKGLVANGRVWAVVERAGEPVPAVAREFGLAAPAEPPEYPEPRRFIRARLLTTVTERYWTALQALARVQAQIADHERTKCEDELSKRWDEAPEA